MKKIALLLVLASGLFAGGLTFKYGMACPEQSQIKTLVQMVNSGYRKESFYYFEKHKCKYLPANNLSVRLYEFNMILDGNIQVIDRDGRFIKVTDGYNNYWTYSKFVKSYGI